jgi:MOSC domain-containing protein YiiM
MSFLERIWIKRGKRAPMDSVKEVLLVVERGLAGNADQGGSRQVTIIEREAWQHHMAALGGDLDPSARRANLMVSGCSLEESRGRILRVGECRIAIGGETKPCEQMEEALPGLRAVMSNNWGGGAFGRVITGGTIRIGDRVEFDVDQA